MELAEKFVRQCRKPEEGLIGRLVGRAMNTGHARIWRWGLSYLSAESYAAVLDVDCGRGGALRDMASLCPAAKLFGIDDSQDMVLSVKRVNHIPFIAIRAMSNRAGIPTKEREFSRFAGLAAENEAAYLEMYLKSLP